MTESNKLNEIENIRNHTWDEGEKALFEITRPKIEKPFDILDVNSWLLRHSNLNDVADRNGFKHSCSEGFPCRCSDASTEMRFYRLHRLLLEVSSLNMKEMYLKKQLERLSIIQNDIIKQSIWVEDHKELAFQKFGCLNLDIWPENEQYDRTSIAVRPGGFGQSYVYLYLKCEDFIQAIEFHKQFSKHYFISSEDEID